MAGHPRTTTTFSSPELSSVAELSIKGGVMGDKGSAEKLINLDSQAKALMDLKNY